MTDAIVYARFSPRRDEEHCISLKTQTDRCRKYIAKQGYTLADTGIFTDTAKSGADSDRPGLWAAVAAIKRGMVLVVYRFDRLARDGFLAYTIERDVIKRGGRIESATGEGEISKTMSPEETMKIGMMRLFAEFERNVIKARTSAGMKYRQSNGEVMTRKDQLPYGWQTDPANNLKMIRNKAEQLVGELIVRMRDSGNSWRKIAELLKKEGAVFRNRPSWHHTTIRNIYLRFKSKP